MPGRRRPEVGPAELLSARSPRLATLAALTRKRSERSAAGAFVLEGPVAVADALRRGAHIREAYLAAGTPELDALAARAAEAGASVFRVERRRLERCLSTVTPRPAAAVATRPDVPAEVLATATSVLVLVGVADPGNVGTLLRTAEAAGFGAVLCCDSAVDPFNPKAVRASAGAVCSLPVITGRDSVQLLEELATLGYRRVATRAGAAATYLEADLCGRVALLLGNEAHGLPASLDACVDEVVRIPMAGEAESLNVAAAGAVLCFEVARRRREVASR